MSPTDITLLGSTGALGRRVLGVLLGAPDRFRVVGLAAGTQGDRLEAQADRCEARFGARPRGGLGEAALRDLAAAPAAGRVVCCVSGLAAWPALRAAAESGHDVVASSKECLALTGPWLRTRLAETGGRLRVLDSELTAAQWLMDTPGDAAGARLILPASGGPFRGRERASLTSVTPEEATAHPVWPMGPKISVDSATLVNKSLEVVVAHRILGLPPARLRVVIHPEARVHAILAPAEGEERALTAPPDMGTPLRHLLGLPTPEARVVSPRPRRGVTFERLDPEHHPGATVGHRALARGPGAIAALVGADEAAVSAFLAGNLAFPEIVPTVARAVAEAPPCEDAPDWMMEAAQTARQRWAERLGG